LSAKEKRQQKSKDIEKNEVLSLRGNDFLFRLAYLLLAIIIFYPPYFRGLFFPTEQLWTLILAALLLLLLWQYKLSKRDLRVFIAFTDYFVLGLVIAYFLAIIGAADQRLALQEALKVLTYAIVYKSAAELILDEKKANGILGVIYSTAIGTALVGIGAALGWIHYESAFEGGRIFSTLQYPNALAAFLGAAFILGLYFWSAYKDKKYWSYLVTALNYILLLVFLATNSRGAFLVFPIAVFLFWLGARKERLYLFGHLAVVILATLIGSYQFIPSVVAGQTSIALLWLGLGLLVALGGEFILQFFFIRRHFKYKEIYLVGAVLLVVIGGMAFLAFFGEAPADASLWERILPSQVAERIKDISLGTQSSATRIYWSQDALKMIGEHPLLGLGGGGWQAAYRAYQGYLYHTTQVHNHWLQVFIEVGIIGFFFWVGMWITFLLAVYKRWRQGDLRIWAVGWAAAAVGVHAFIDFDLALGAVSIMLFSLLGTGTALAFLPTKEISKSLSLKKFREKKLPYQIGSVVLPVLIILIASSLLLGSYYSQKAREELQAQDATAITSLERAARFDPFEARYRADLAQLYLSQKKPAEALAMMESALRKAPYSWELWSTAGDLYWQMGEVERAIEALEKGVSYFPWSTAMWENLTRIYTYAAAVSLDQGQIEDAKRYISGAESIPLRMEELKNSLGEREKSLWREWESFGLTPDQFFHLGMLSYLKGDYQKAETYLTAALSDEKTKENALLWLAALQAKEMVEGNYLQEYLSLNPNGLKEVQRILTLKPIS